MSTWDRDLWKLWPLLVVAFSVMIVGYAGYWPSVPLSLSRFAKSNSPAESSTAHLLVEWLAKQDPIAANNKVNADHFTVVDMASKVIPDASTATFTRPQITRVGSSFFCQWQVKRRSVTASPVTIFGSWSADGERWSDPQLIFSHEGEPAATQVLALAPILAIHNELYSVVAVHEIVGFSTSDATTFSAPKAAEMSAEFPRAVREIVGYFVRRIQSNGTLGPRITLLRRADEVFSVAEAMRGIEIVDQPLIPDIVSQLATDDSRFGGKMEFPVPEIETDDRYKLSYPTTVAISDNRWLRLWASEQGLDRLYGQVSPDNGATWEKPIPTNIRNEGRFAVLGKLPSGSIILVGNQFRAAEQVADPLTIAIAFEKLQFTECFELRRGAPARISSQEPLDRREKAEQLGFQVGGCLVDGADVWVVYSVNAESIDISRVRLRDLAPALADSNSQIETAGRQ